MKHALTISVTIMSVMFMLLAVTAFAQMDELRNTTPGERARIETAMMKMKLQLIPQQMQQVGSINLKYAKQMDPIIKGSQPKLRKMLQANTINQAKDEELRTVLSPDQYERYMASKEDMRKEVAEQVRTKRASAGWH